MERKPQRNKVKPHFCCDHNLQFSTLNKECNRFGIYKTSKSLLHKENATDPEIIEYCIKNDYHIITHNKDNFKNYSRKTKVGIIYIGSQDPKYWLNKFIGFMKTHPDHEDIYYLIVSILGGELSVLDRRSIRNK